ncbi:hypothetical protein [Streptomyces sp. HUAS ZL42]|uniref:hypothetical protein n=1 Tax=Streptomyces sp. HUAS ZL42 TaxID=3231715 RepID=UPI00345EF26D
MKHMRLSLRSLTIVGISATGGATTRSTIEHLMETWGQSSSLGTLAGIAVALLIAEKLDAIIAPDKTDEN